MAGKSCCGIDCQSCGAYKATAAGDNEALKAVAVKWSGIFGKTVEPEDLVCDGCGADRVGKYCKDCGFISCSSEKGVGFCKDCDTFPCKNYSDFADNQEPFGTVIRWDD